MDRWIPNAVIYQVNLRSLAAREPRNAIEAASEADVTSTPLAFLARNVIVLANLGVNVLHLMPPFTMGKAGRKGIGSPYAVHDYRSVDPELGTLEELRGCIRAAHIHNLKLIIGMVPNHTSRDHAWIHQSPDYYVKGGDGSPAYDADWTDTAKLDYSRQDLRQEMVEIYDFWLSLLGEDESGVVRGVDGFRIDMAHFINDLSFWDEAIRELNLRHPKREILFLAECYGLANNLDLFGRGFNAAYDDDFYKICLNFYAVNEEGQTCIMESPDASRQDDFAPYYAAYQDRGIAGAMETLLTDYEAKLSADENAPRLARYTDNHDEGRGVYRFGDGAVIAVNQLIFLTGHAMPFLLTGQEFGAENRPPIHTRIGTCDKGRRILRGDGSTYEPGIEFEGNLFARSMQKRRGWYDFYQDLIALRQQTPELVRGNFRLIEAGEDAPQNRRTVIAFERKHGEGMVRCAVNLGPEARRLNHISLFQYEPIYGQLDQSTLLPFTSVVVRCT
jgi:glycosidase